MQSQQGKTAALATAAWTGTEPLAIWHSTIGRYLIGDPSIYPAVQATCYSCGTCIDVFKPGGKRTPICPRCYAMSKKHLMASKPGVKAGFNARHGALLSPKRSLLLADVATIIPNVTIINSKAVRFEQWLKQILLVPPPTPLLLIRFAAKPTLVARQLRVSHSLGRLYLCSDNTISIDARAVAHAAALLAAQAVPARVWRLTLRAHAVVQRMALAQGGANPVAGRLPAAAGRPAAVSESVPASTV